MTNQTTDRAFFCFQDKGDRATRNPLDAHSLRYGSFTTKDAASLMASASCVFEHCNEMLVVRQELAGRHLHAESQPMTGFVKIAQIGRPMACLEEAHDKQQNICTLHYRVFCKVRSCQTAPWPKLNVSSAKE